MILNSANHQLEEKGTIIECRSTKSFILRWKLKHSVVGWDGKIVKSVIGSNKSVDYLAIVLSGAPNMVEDKLLEVEEVVDGKGSTQADVTYKVLESCNALESLRALLFDTTSANTGV